MSFECPEVIECYIRTLGLDKMRAEALFGDVKRFLFMRGISPKGPGFAPPPRIENGWHVFAGCSDAYDRFCRSSFGYSIAPQPKGFAAPRAQAVQRSVAAARILFGDHLSDNWNAE